MLPDPFALEVAGPADGVDEFRFLFLSLTVGCSEATLVSTAKGEGGGGRSWEGLGWAWMFF